MPTELFLKGSFPVLFLTRKAKSAVFITDERVKERYQSKTREHEKEKTRKFIIREKCGFSFEIGINIISASRSNEKEM